MSTFSQHYYHYQEQPLFIDPHAFVYGGQYDTRRSKTPTDSLLNHTGLSPGPLSTPPLSRNQSQQPELPRDQPPEQLLWDNGSSSNSPTSVRTPDGSESFEVEMLDSDTIPNYYHHNGNSMSTQSPHSAIPAMDSSMLFTAQGTFSDQGLLTLHSHPSLLTHTQQSRQRFMRHSRLDRNTTNSSLMYILNSNGHLTSRQCTLKPTYTPKATLPSHLVMIHGTAKDLRGRLWSLDLAMSSSIL
jgi:hypothetical protein